MLSPSLQCDDCRLAIVRLQRCPHLLHSSATGSTALITDALPVARQPLVARGDQNFRKNDMPRREGLISIPDAGENLNPGDLGLPAQWGPRAWPVEQLILQFDLGCPKPAVAKSAKKMFSAREYRTFCGRERIQVENNKATRTGSVTKRGCPGQAKAEQTLSICSGAEC